MQGSTPGVLPGGQGPTFELRGGKSAPWPPSMSPRLLLSVSSYAVIEVSVVSPSKSKSIRSDRAQPFCGLRVVAALVVGNRVAVVVRIEPVAAGSEHVSAEDRGGAVDVAAMHVEQRAERLARLEQQLARQANSSKPPIASLSPVKSLSIQSSARLVEDRDARRNVSVKPPPIAPWTLVDAELAVARASDRASKSWLGFFVSNLTMPAGVLRPNSVPCGPRNTSTRSRSNSGRALQDDVFEHHLIHDDGHGLRGREVEVGVAEAANVEAGRDPAVRRFGIEARHAGCERPNVFAALEQGVHALASSAETEIGTSCMFSSRRCRGDEYLLELAGILGLSRAGREGGGCECLRAGARQRPKRSGFRCQESLPCLIRLYGRAWNPRSGRGGEYRRSAPAESRNAQLWPTTPPRIHRLRYRV